MTKSAYGRFVMIAMAAALGLGLSLATATAGDATNWPNRKTIEIVLGAKAGGDTDAQIRRFAKYLEKALDTSIAIVNMPGSSATIASQYVHDADPDGYTMMALNPESFAPYYFGISDYNSEDYAIAGIGAMDETLVFCTRKGSPYPTLESLVAAAKANPGRIELPAMQPGGYSYMSALLFQTALGVQFNLTDIASNGEKIVQLLAGKVEVIGNQYWFIEDYVKSGDFVVYCVMADERNPAFPDVPTMKELGYDIGITCVPKYFYFAFPKGTDKAIVAKFSDALKRVVESPEYVADARGAMTTPLDRKSVV